ncbi:gephyrin-like molybdotransferase Glp [Methanobacterium sp.]|uniref:molybdopterin molybdotransferase MoeA n=1 Tax=Methanobacterium sp. TaxID=2164 RepID=UPI003C77AB88
MFLTNLMPVKKAQKIIDSSLKNVGVERISLEDAHRRVLAETITSELNSPPFERSAMDGYAIHAEDSFGFSETNPAKLRIIDTIGAGQVSSKLVKHGEAVRIATGAPIPEGANSVVMEEFTNSQGDNLEVEMTLTPGENISPMGEDIKKGDIVLRTGKILRPQDLALIASAGYDSINVFKKPKIAVITTGNELVMPRPSLNGAEIINSNHYTFKAMVESALAIPTVVHCVDSHELVENKFKKLIKTHDALISTGGTAISKGDVVVDVTENIGKVLIHGVALRPGKPFGFGIIDEKPVFMLSGYPIAAIVQADVFVRNSLHKMQGIENELQIIRKTASRKIPSSLGRTDYIRAKTELDMVRPLKIKGSGIIRSMVESDAYIIIEENVEGIGEGEGCNVLPYDSLTV